MLIVISRHTPDDGMWTLFRLVSRFRWREATDPRDKVYGLLGLATRFAESTFFMADYNLTVEQVYIRATLESMYTEDSLRILLGTETTVASRYRLPCWCPDWSVPSLFGDSDLLFYRAEWFQYRAAGSQKAHPKLLGSEILQVEGILVGTVQFIDITSLWPHATKDKALEAWASRKYAAIGVWNDMGNSHRAYCNGGSWDDAFLETTVAGRILREEWTESKEMESRKITLDDLEELREYFGSGSNCTPVNPTAPVSVQRWVAAGGIEDTVRWANLRRLFFLTDSDHMGLAPLSTVKGDEIWILKGGSMPFVLRAVGGEDKYRFVGDCYVHGVMEGEAERELATNPQRVLLV
jgi:hypothetical protein